MSRIAARDTKLRGGDSILHKQEITMDQAQKRGEVPPHREDEEARQRAAQEEARPSKARSTDERGRDKGRSGSGSNR